MTRPTMRPVMSGNEAEEADRVTVGTVTSRGV
jgi:hypothetical protein